MSVVPSMDLVMVLTGAGLSPDPVFDAVMAAVSDGPLPPNPEGDAELDAMAEELRRGPEPEPVDRLPTLAHRISGRTYTFGANDFGLRSLRLDLDDPNEAILRLDVASEARPRVDRIGLDGGFRPSIEGRPLVARGHWEDERTFVLEFDTGPGISSYEVRARFQGNRLRVELLGTVHAFVWASAS